MSDLVTVYMCILCCEKVFWNVFLRDIIRFKLLNNNVHVDELSELSDDVKGPVLDSIVTQGNMLDFQV